MSSTTDILHADAVARAGMLLDMVRQFDHEAVELLDGNRDDLRRHTDDNAANVSTD